ncbi:hypothetical protein Hanom_Chr03g00263951 [Helianthus anomalus]
MLISGGVSWETTTLPLVLLYGPTKNDLMSRRFLDVQSMPFNTPHKCTLTLSQSQRQVNYTIQSRFQVPNSRQDALESKDKDKRVSWSPGGHCIAFICTTPQVSSGHFQRFTIKQRALKF